VHQGLAWGCHGQVFEAAADLFSQDGLKTMGGYRCLAEALTTKGDLVLHWQP